MKVTFVANFMNHHQFPFSERMAKLTDNNYFFVACTPVPKERLDGGYSNMNDLPFVIKFYERDGRENALQHVLKDDYVIFGSCPNYLVDLRKETGKPFIIYSERFFKRGTLHRFIPITFFKIYKRMLKFERSNVTVLCSSAYLPYDLSLLKSYFMIYKWGYFPQFVSCDLEHLLRNKKPHSIIWVGRLITWKHPEYCIYLANFLRKNGIDFDIEIIGAGPLKKSIDRKIKKHNLSEHVKLLGSIKASEVREHMNNSQIFIFTSDSQEGWGAVLNEAMSSACAIVANNLPGSVPFLIEHNKNGLVCSFNNKKLFAKYVASLLNNEKERICLAKNAFLTIKNEWNSDIATERLYYLMNNKLIDNKKTCFDSGPCSEAKIIKPKRRID